jgi:hypothetical protein
MVKYTIDKNNREYIYYLVALISILLTPFFNYYIDLLSTKLPFWKFLANFHLTGFIIFGLILFIFNNLIWKIKSLSGIPNLNGTWVGNYIRYNDEGHEISVEEAIERFKIHPEINRINIIIEQNWLKMSIFYEAAHSISDSTSINLKIENRKIFNLIWTFDSRIRTGLTPSNKYGNGISNATIRELKNPEVLEGTYYTQKGNRGFFIVKKQDL